jgi:protoporphyrinogen oxidase
MWERTTSRVEELGGRVLLRHRVVGLETSRGRVVAVRALTPEGEVRFETDHVISTMPLRSLAESLEPAVSPQILEAAHSIRYRDFLVVALILDAENLFADNWIYVHDPAVRVGRIQNFKNWSADLVPDASKTCLGMEYFCFEGDDLWTADDETLLDLARGELRRLGLADSDSVVDGCVVRMPKAYPIYDENYSSRVSTVRGAIDRIPNLQTVGRNGMHKYNNQDHSMLTAMMAVWNMEGQRHDIWSVNTDFEYHETQRLSPSSTPSSSGSEAA